MTEKQWWKQLEDLPPNNIAWLAFADWLEEQGEDGKAEGARVIFTKELEPVHTASFRNWKGLHHSLSTTRSYDWRIEREEDTPVVERHCTIDRNIFCLLTGFCLNPENLWREYRTPSEAYQDLLDAYAKLKEKHHDGR